MDTGAVIIPLQLLVILQADGNESRRGRRYTDILQGESCSVVTSCWREFYKKRAPINNTKSNPVPEFEMFTRPDCETDAFGRKYGKKHQSAQGWNHLCSV